MATNYTAQAADSGARLTIGVTAAPLESGGTRVSRERFLRIDLPQGFTVEHAAQMQKDFEALSEIAAQHPEAVTQVQNAVVVHDFETAGRLAKKIGLTEEQLAARGGAQVALAGGILVALVVVALVLGSDSPPPPEPPPLPEGGPPPVDAGSDADAGAG